MSTLSVKLKALEFLRGINEQEFETNQILLYITQRTAEVICFTNKLLWESNWLENSSHLMKIFLLRLKELFSGWIFSPIWLTEHRVPETFFPHSPTDSPSIPATEHLPFIQHLFASLLTLYKYRRLVKIQIEGAKTVIHSLRDSFWARLQPMMVFYVKHPYLCSNVSAQLTFNLQQLIHQFECIIDTENPFPISAFNRLIGSISKNQTAVFTARRFNCRDIFLIQMNRNSCLHFSSSQWNTRPNTVTNASS